MFKKVYGMQQEITAFEADGRATLYVTLEIENEELDNLVASSIGSAPHGVITLFIDFEAERMEASAEYAYDDNVNNYGGGVDEKSVLMKLITELSRELSKDPLAELWIKIMLNQLKENSD